MNDDSDFEIVIDDENIEPNWEVLMPTTCQEIEEFENNCEKF